MKNYKTLLVFSVLLFAPPLATQADIFLKIEGIEGEVKFQGDSGWFQMESVDGLADAVTRRPPGVNRPVAGQAVAEPVLVLTRKHEKASPHLAQIATKRKDPSSAKLYRNGEMYHLEGVRISVLKTQEGVETIQLHYKSFRKSDSVPPAKASPAQDYNSSRSNKARG